LPIIAVVLMVYALYGSSLPGILAHPGNTWKSVVNHLYLTSQGIFGIALGVVATYVFHYVLFGVLATRVGLGRFFIDLATALTGRFSGGPAKVSIFGSGLFGMIWGSLLPNPVPGGSPPMPAMIRVGYAGHFAGAVESTAATGGQITPPIMGAAAFLMVEYLSIPYQTIIIAAITPACMHFVGVFCQVHFEAKKRGMRGMTAADLPRIGDVARRSGASPRASLSVSAIATRSLPSPCWPRWWRPSLQDSSANGWASPSFSVPAARCRRGTLPRTPPAESAYSMFSTPSSWALSTPSASAPPRPPSASSSAS